MTLRYGSLKLRFHIASFPGSPHANETRFHRQLNGLKPDKEKYQSIQCVHTFMLRAAVSSESKSLSEWSYGSYQPHHAIFADSWREDGREKGWESPFGYCYSSKNCSEIRVTLSITCPTQVHMQ